jgi:hypothetical protein
MTAKTDEKPFGIAAFGMVDTICFVARFQITTKSRRLCRLYDELNIVTD